MPKDEEEQQEFIDLLRVYTEILSPFFVVCRNLSLEDSQDLLAETTTNIPYINQKELDIEIPRL